MSKRNVGWWSRKSIAKDRARFEAQQRAKHAHLIQPECPEFCDHGKSMSVSCSECDALPWVESFIDDPFTGVR